MHQENTHTHMEIPKGRGVSKQKFLKESINQNWNFQRKQNSPVHAGYTVL